MQMFGIFALIEAIWLILPAYAANGLTPLIGRRKKLHRMDFGREFRGKPLLGKGKSWEGLAFGSLVGMAIASVEMLAFPYLPFGMSPVEMDIVAMSPALGFLLGFGALLGDAAGSLLKRRMNIKSGNPAPLLDQLDFLAGALVFSAVLVPLKLEWIVMLAIITPVIHMVSSMIGFRLKVKRNPW
jgi:CDP-2,3-bis-(O-geranylgeranyl)-sn-glycerol synthase